MELAEAVDRMRAQYKGQGTAVGSQVTVSAGFDLSPAREGTKVVWQGETNIFGKLASMAGGMLEPLGRKNIQKLIDGLQKALAEAAPLTAEAVPTQCRLGTLRTGGAATGSAQGAQSQVSPEQIGHQLAAVPMSTADSSAVEPTSSTVEAPGFSPVNNDRL